MHTMYNVKKYKIEKRSASVKIYGKLETIQSTDTLFKTTTNWRETRAVSLKHFDIDKR